MKYETMSEKYLNLFLEAENWYMYFDEISANEKAEEIRQRGKEAEIYRENDKWMVFELIKIIKI